MTAQLVTPQGTYSFGFEHLEDAIIAGYSLWFTHKMTVSYGAYYIAVVTKENKAVAVLCPVSVYLNKL